MSYILEALKKAQAERQLGSAPTIHAAPLHPVAASPEASRKPLLVGLGAGALVAGAAAFALMRPAAPPAPAVPPVVVAAVPPASIAAPVSPPIVPAPAPRPPVAEARPVAVASVPAPKPAAPKSSPTPVAPEPVPAPVAAPAPAPVEDSAVALSQLPEAIQREIPKVAIGGYIYSPNPAERLLLIDKVLRREGEEVAPGLMLERLLPKAAVMNYRGYRYRVPY